MTRHAAVWIDHKEARIFHVEAETFDESTLKAPHHVARHPKSQTSDKYHPEEERQYFHEVAQALEGADQILVLGPSTAKLHFLKYLHKHKQALEPRIVGIETVDHPSDRQIAAYVHQVLVDVDRVLIVRTLWRELEIDWPGIEVILRLREQLADARARIAELESAVRRATDRDDH